jgi:hypothetical protein
MLQLAARSLLVLSVLCPLQPALADGSWYYCEPAHQYYPYIHTCPVPWREVAATRDTSSQSESKPFQEPFSQAQPQTSSAYPSITNGDKVTTEGSIRLRYFENLAANYWQATGIGGVILALGALSILLGAASMRSRPAYSEVSPPGTRSVEGRVYHYRARVPTRSQIRLGQKLILCGFLLVLSGSCISWGPTVVYHFVQEATKGLL